MNKQLDGGNINLIVKLQSQLSGIYFVYSLLAGWPGCYINAALWRTVYGTSARWNFFHVHISSRYDQSR